MMISDTYLVFAPDGKQLHIPKELYVALSDFLKTRKPAGFIKVQFHGGDITCVEATVRRTYRKPDHQHV